MKSRRSEGRESFLRIGAVLSLLAMSSCQIAPGQQFQEDASRLQASSFQTMGTGGGPGSGSGLSVGTGSGIDLSVNGASQCYDDQFRQPDWTSSGRKVDLLFVLDSS